MVCERCKQRDALSSGMFVFGTTGAFCSACLSDLTRTFYEEHPEIMASMPPGMTVEQLVEGQLRFMGGMLEVSDPSDHEEVIRKLREMSE